MYGRTVYSYERTNMFSLWWVYTVTKKCVHCTAKISNDSNIIRSCVVLNNSFSNDLSFVVSLIKKYT